MKRRVFVKTSILTTAATVLTTQLSMATEHITKESPDFYELRVYSLKDGRQQKMVEDYFENAAIPALNQLGSKNIGVFTEFKARQASLTRLYALDSLLSP